MTTTFPTDDPKSRALYRERAQLLAWITAALAPTAVLSISDPQHDWMAVLHVPSAAGALTWHIHPDDLDLFAHLQFVSPSDPRARWDGADKTETLRRLTTLALAAGGLA
ncbi:hypothetical protein [Nocardia salmonicida]|uniref:hypothetical protein n=1 Tax=Nocardia salmonicida TaxID=53431 RepID=UPI0007A473CF|nr:hypothetical protein [Nocardia salmonicida]MBC7299828.1 hypothetical protein [Nocardia sp.]